MKLPSKYRKFQTPIKTVEQAKEFFMAMRCSHYGMAGDYPQRYDDYMELNISKQIEKEWKKERFYEFCSDILTNTDSDLLWSLHSEIEYLYEVLKTEEELMKLLEITKHIREKVPPYDKVKIAETINGRTVRSARSGLIYMAYDSGNPAVSREFAELSLYFSTCNNDQDQDRERCEEATQLCNSIISELGL